MDSFELNKIAGAVLAALLVIFGGKEIIHIAEGGHAKGTKKAGYTLPVEVASAAPSGAAPAAKKGFEFATVAALLPTAKVDAGQGVFKKCATCHTPNQGGKNGQGPNLWNIVNRDLAASDGFKYSKAMAQKGGKWDYESLALFLHKPKTWLKGTKMAFAGLKKPADIANLLAYMQSLSDSPVPFPAQ
ncbi:MAG: cytochrome c family protein [Pseudomonadota bacterium]